MRAKRDRTWRELAWIVVVIGALALWVGGCADDTASVEEDDGDGEMTILDGLDDGSGDQTAGDADVPSDGDDAMADMTDQTDAADQSDQSDVVMPPAGPNRIAVSSGGGRRTSSRFVLDLTIGSPVAAQQVESQNYSMTVGIGPFIE